MSRFALAPALVALALLAGCEGCRDKKPYTPFGVTSALPPPSAPGSVAEPAASAPGERPTPRKAALTPKDARQFAVGERSIESPPGRVFEQVLEADFDVDGSADAAAWTLPAPDATPDAPPGELWLYPANGEPRKLLDFPPFVPTGADCRHETAIEQAGKLSISVDVLARCDSPRIARTPTRALALVDAQARDVRFGLRIADPAPGEKLTLALSAADEDSDGREDFRLSIALAHESADSGARAALVWLDRAAGVSRDAREPARSLEALLSTETVRARNKKNAPSAMARTESVRRLLGTLCAEGRVPRIFEWDGAPLRCGNLGTVIDRAATVDVNGALAVSDVPLAFSVLTRDGWYFGRMTERQRDVLRKEIEKKVQIAPAARITLGARPRRFTGPGYSPLTFLTDGTLLMQSEGGLFQLAPDGAREEPVAADSGAMPWPLEVTTSQGARLLAVSYSCDRSEVGLVLAGGSEPTQLTRLLAPRPGVCSGQRFEENFVPTPVSATNATEILIGGVRLGPVAAPPPGSPRSADGRWIAIPTPLGLLTQGTASLLWKIDGFSGGASGCVVANGARRAACIRNGQAELYLRSDDSQPP